MQVGLLIGEAKPVALPFHEVISKELELYGSHGMPAHAYPEMLEMIVSGALGPQKLIAKTISLTEAGPELTAMGGFALDLLLRQLGGERVTGAYTLPFELVPGRSTRRGAREAARDPEASGKVGPARPVPGASARRREAT